MGVPCFISVTLLQLLRIDSYAKTGFEKEKLEAIYSSWQESDQIKIISHRLFVLLDLARYVRLCVLQNWCTLTLPIES